VKAEAIEKIQSFMSQCSHQEKVFDHNRPALDSKLDELEEDVSMVVFARGERSTRRLE
jgi:hypothetical protein